MDNKLNNIDIKKLNSLSDKEKSLLFSILQEFKEKGYSEKYEHLKYPDYAEIPVDIETFLTDDNYLGKAWKDIKGNSLLYPFWLEQLKKIFPNNTDTNYTTLLESGARGIGKSQIGCGAAGAYLMYRVMCLRDPQDFFHLQPTEKIIFAFMNITKDASKKIAIDKFQKTIQLSPWFMARGKMIQFENNPYWVPPKPLEIVIGSQSSDVIGKPIFFAFFDEISFIRNQDIDKQKEKARDMIDTAIGGMKTRFIHDGKNPTLLVVASSKRSEQSFMESYIRELSEIDGQNVYVVDKPVWEVKPAGTYGEGTFKVGLGNKFLANKIIEDAADVNIYREKGYKIIDVPLFFKTEFLKDLDRGLCDFAGISTASSSKYISGELVQQCIDETLQNPFPDVLEIGNASDDLRQYKQFFDLSKIPADMINKPLFIHLDMSISGDMTGIAGVWISGKKPSTDESQQAKDLSFRLAFSTSIKAPKGRQISFEKNRNFIRWLREAGFNIREVTTDSFQSADSHQQLSAEGFKCSILSVDRVDTDRINKPYQYLKNTVYEKRLTMYRSDRLYDEFIDVERNMNTGKVDHTPNGHKDALDAVCLDGDTKIYTLSGKDLTIKELYNNFENEWVLAYNTEVNKLEPVKISDVVNNGYKDNIVKLTLDNGKELICTDDHLLLTRDNKYIKAGESLGVSLMPFNYEDRVMFKNREYRYVYTPNSDGSLTGIYLHKLVGESVLYEEKTLAADRCKDKEWVVIHHKDCNRLNNNPDNLEYLTNKEHTIKHSELNSSSLKRQQLRESNRNRIESGEHPFVKMTKEQRQLQGHKARLSLNKSEKHRLAISRSNKEKVLKGIHNFQINNNNSHTPEANAKREKTCIERYGGRGFKSDIIQQRCRENCLKNNGYDNPFHSKEKQHEMSLSKIRLGWLKICEKFNLDANQTISLFDFKIYYYILDLKCSTKVKDLLEANIPVDFSNYSEKEYFSLRDKGTCARLILKELNKDTFTYSEFLECYTLKSNTDKKFKRRFKDAPSYEDLVKLGFNVYNHKVIKIERLPGREVYDIKLDKIHNFALCCGIFVHNCGATFTASKYAEEYAYDYGESIESIVAVNNKKTDEDIKKQLIVDFEEELQKMNNPFSDTTPQSDTDDSISNSFIDSNMLIW